MLKSTSTSFWDKFMALIANLKIIFYVSENWEGETMILWFLTVYSSEKIRENRNQRFGPPKWGGSRDQSSFRRVFKALEVRGHRSYITFCLHFFLFWGGCQRG
jgi:hypothetical protein